MHCIPCKFIFSINIVSDSCPFRQPFATGTFTAQLEMISRSENWSQRRNAQNLKRLVKDISIFSAKYWCESFTL